MVRRNTGLGMQILLEIQRNPADISITRMENVVRIKGKEKEQGTTSYAILSTNSTSHCTLISCDSIARD